MFRAAAASLFGVAFPPGDAALPWVPGRNAHARDLILRGADGTPLLRMGVATGFRNIQALVRRGGRGGGALPGGGGGGGGAGTAGNESSAPALPPPHSAGPYDYVEVMACPGGCTNGGGQLRGAGAGEATAAADAALAGPDWAAAAAAAGEALLGAASTMPTRALWAGYRTRGEGGSGAGAAAAVVAANNW